MLISRTPLRVSFVGGGTDLPAFYRKYGGAVVSVSVKKYVYLSMHEYFERDGFVLKYSHLENARTVEDINHRIIRQVFSDFNIRGVDFNSSADVPAGTGMGSSSAFTVGLLNLCHAYQGKYVSRARLAEMACEVEIEKLKEPIGKQDQFGCALGGLNYIQFMPDETVIHEPIIMNKVQRDKLERNLVMYYLGGTRSASALLKAQTEHFESDGSAVDNMKSMMRQAEELRVILPTDVDALGPYLHEAWERKRTLAHGISNSVIEDAYTLARKHGATGGKLLGAGGSGFLLLYVPEERQLEVFGSLENFQRHSFKVDEQGSTIIYSDA